MARPTNTQRAINALLALNPYPVTFSESELKSRIELEQAYYHTRISFTDQELTAKFKVSASNVFDLLERVKSQYEAGRTHAINDHFISTNANILNASLIFVKTESEQTADLEKLAQKVESDYRVEIAKAQREHVQKLTDQALADIQAQQAKELAEKQQAARQALADAFLNS